MSDKFQKKLIINADDLGISLELNAAVLKAANEGILTQSSLMANGECFDDAINRVIHNCPKLAVGVHLNLFEGKALTNCPLLTDKNGYFSESFIQTLLNSFDANFLLQIENEWDAQIKKIVESGIIPTHLDSHVHYHAIPNLFKIAVKLAEKYNIKNIRTQRELFYVTDFNLTYCVNIIKNLLLNFFTFINTREKKYSSNDYLIGVLYTSMMSSKQVVAGLKKLPNNCLAEVLIHPKINQNLAEYDLLFSEELKDFLKSSNIKLTNYKGDSFDVQ